MPRGVGDRVPLSAQGFEDEQRKLSVFFLSCADKGTRTRCGGSADLAVDTDAEPQPVVSGYIEFAGEIVKISSVEDIERVLERIKATDKA